ncbi:MAG: hypothetical protein QOC55_2261, partial [Thermoleophilaceae bacterium]|nr:hypothetical protein [Thermoleophilaceae bacterium]
SAILGLVVYLTVTKTDQPRGAEAFEAA